MVIIVPEDLKYYVVFVQSSCPRHSLCDLDHREIPFLLSKSNTIFKTLKLSFYLNEHLR